MTNRHNGAEWLDVLYSSVRGMPGGVAAAATFLTTRRERNITAESLRLRLRGEGENRLSMEMFELLLEWMQDARQPNFLDALHALNERFGLRANPVHVEDEPATAGRVALHTLDLANHAGDVAEVVRAALEDDRITAAEADAIAIAARKNQRVLERLLRLVIRMARKGRD